MNSFRFPLAAAIFTALFSLSGSRVWACPGQEGECACAKAAANTGAPADAAAAATQAGHDEKDAAGECSGHAENAKKGEKAAAGATEGKAPACAATAAKVAPAGEKLKAVLDPATGKLIEPADDEPSDDGTTVTAARTAGKNVAKEVTQPGGGVMVAAPGDRTPKAVATIDAKGEAQTGCAE